MSYLRGRRNALPDYRQRGKRLYRPLLAVAIEKFVVVGLSAPPSETITPTPQTFVYAYHTPLVSYLGPFFQVLINS